MFRFYYMRILSVSAIHGSAIWVPVWNVFHTDRLCYAVLGWRDMLTIGLMEAQEHVL